jgi:hypothetical protein
MTHREKREFMKCAWRIVYEIVRENLGETATAV